LDAKEAELKANGEFAEGNLAIEDASADYI
jgi:hypothetical protein